MRNRLERIDSSRCADRLRKSDREYADVCPNIYNMMTGLHEPLHERDLLLLIDA